MDLYGNSYGGSLQQGSSGSSGSGFGQGGLWGILAQRALGALDNFAYNIQNVDDSTWLMRHFPGFASWNAQGNSNGGAVMPEQKAESISPIIQQNMQDQASLSKTASEQAFERWKLQQTEEESKKNREMFLEMASKGYFNGNNSGGIGLSPDRISYFDSIVGGA